MIPKIIHQSFQSKKALLPEMVENIERIMEINRGWEYRFYSDEDQCEFIREIYGEEILNLYRKINPLYGAARADFFRYLLIYRCGGVWLDIKSSIFHSLDKSLKSRDQLILSQWVNPSKPRGKGWGHYPELRNILGGEFQQWHIISTVEHPLIKEVIEQVIDNIGNYSMERVGYGKMGVLRTTGPIAYTLAIYPKLSMYPHRFVDIYHDFGFVYSVLDSRKYRKSFSMPHYSELTERIVL